MSTDARPPRLGPKSRVRHEHYGAGTVTSYIDGEWLLVLFDRDTFAVSVHVRDLEVLGNG